MTEAQKQELLEAVAQCHEALAKYATKYARVGDPHELLNEQVLALIKAADKDFSSYARIRNLAAVLKRRIRRRVSQLIAQREMREEGRLVDGRAERVGAKTKEKKKGKPEVVLTEIRLDADNTGAHNALAEIAKIQSVSQPFLKAMIKADTVALLKKAIDVLPPKLKQYVDWRFFQELSPEDIRAMTGASEKQVERWREQALKKLHDNITRWETER